MKSILKIVFVIIGTLIGAGFASGQEMYIFFYSYGINGIWGLIVSSFFIGIIIYKTLNIIEKYNISNYKDFLEIIINRDFDNNYLNIKNIVNIIINIFILITFFIMIAGFGAYFEQTLKINHFVGSIVLAFMCFIIFKTSIKGLIKSNEILIPILIILIGFIGIYNLMQIDFSYIINKIFKNNSSGWLLNSLLYSSYNSIILIPTLITLKDYLNKKSNIILISIFTVIIVMFLSNLLFFILANIDIDIVNIEMPVVYAVGKIYKGLTLVYGFVIIASIFTTSISLGTSFLQNTVKNEKSYTHVAALMCITSVITSKFGFSNLVSLLYPIFGYIGFVQIFKIILKK